MSRHGDEIDHSPNLPSQPVSRRYIPPTDWKPIARDQRVSASIRPLERSSPASSLPDVRNDLSIYDTAAATWWSSETRWVRTLQNMVPGRLAYFDQLVDWSGKDVLDLGCAGGFMAEALAKRGARVTGIDPAKGA
ncbi:MAG: methyltransferase domain-containing protein, partial [Pseudomonadota bacterium]